MTFLLRTFQLGMKSLLLHPMRSLLTVLGIFIGVASVIWLLAIGEGISIEAQRQIEYKARWVGLPIIRLFRRETRGSSVSCPRCGERLQSDKRLKRKLWCSSCRIVMDRDVVAAVNLARRGRVRFARSRPPIIEAQGGAVEAMKGNPTPTVIPGVDAPKLTQPTKS